MKNRKDYDRRYRERMKNNPAYRHAQQVRDAERARACLAVRVQLITAMGGVCRRCGFCDNRALTFHHTRGDGAKVRRETKGSSGYSVRLKYYRRLLTDYLSDPSSLDLLCLNCHAIIHDDERSSRAVGVHKVAPDCVLLLDSSGW